jgi:phage repressor protein C with HTH and peptisase S24 domain
MCLEGAACDALGSKCRDGAHAMLASDPAGNGPLLNAKGRGGVLLAFEVRDKALVSRHSSILHRISYDLRHRQSCLQAHRETFENRRMEYKDRLKQARKHAKLSQLELAQRVGITQTSISDLERGKSASSSYNASIAKNCGVSAIWLENGTGPMIPVRLELAVHNKEMKGFEPAGSGNVQAYDPEDQLPDDAVAISEYQVNFSAGNGHQALYEIIEESDPAIYKLSWFRAERIKPEKCKRFRVRGDSMETTLFDGDSVLVNMEENEPTKIIDGKVYALRYGNDLRIKRLFKKLDGSLRLVSDNQAYPIEDIAADVAQEHITIIGRVRDKSGKGGL